METSADQLSKKSKTMVNKDGQHSGRTPADAAGQQLVDDAAAAEHAKSQKIRNDRVDVDALLDGKKNEFEQYTDFAKTQGGRLESDGLRILNDMEEIQPMRADLTAQECEHVLTSWTTLREKYDLKRVGIIMLRQLHKVAPDTFTFLLNPPEGSSLTSPEEQLQAFFKTQQFTSAAEEAAQRVDSIVNLVCTNQQQLSASTKLNASPDKQTVELAANLKRQLKEMGREYIDSHDIKPEAYHYGRIALLTTLAMGLQAQFPAEVKDSWEKFAKFTREAMISDNYEQQDEEHIVDDKLANRIKNIDGPVPKKLTPSEDVYKQTEQDQEQDEPALKVPREITDYRLTASQANNIQQLWSRVDLLIGNAEMAKQIFRRFLELEPEATKLFNFISPNMSLDMIFLNPKTQNHAKKMYGTISWVVENCHNMQKVHKKLSAIASQHVGYGVKPEYYKVLMQAAIDAMEKGFGSDFTDQQRRAWQVLFESLEDIMTSQPAPDVDIHNLEDRGTPPATPREDPNVSNVLDDSVVQLHAGEDGKGRKTNQMEKTLKKEIKDHYLEMFRKEVDFHHKIAYRFEKAYRLGKEAKAPVDEEESEGGEDPARARARQKMLNNIDIIDCLGHHSDYVEQDPMCLFYCLFFCIYYNNEEILEFLMPLIEKIDASHAVANEKINQLLALIEQNNIAELRAIEQKANRIAYHLVLYQAIDDNLRIVYANILRQLRFVQLRDSDALHLLRQRDYELIQLTFSKHPAQLPMSLFGEKAEIMRCHSYRKYNQAYYEEIVILNEGSVEARVVQNYRERFLVTQEDIYVVFQMYAKEDYDEQFMKTKKDHITHAQFLELLRVCLRNDSYRIAMLIYTCYIDPVADIDANIMSIVIQQVREKVIFQEMKLFFIHQHFDLLSIPQYNTLIDHLAETTATNDTKVNPMISQYNTIKIALLIYRICWKIEQKQIYSLITKSQALQAYLMRSLKKYLAKQNNILTLHKFMTEPILHLTRRQDCLDIMLEMDMHEILCHPVIVEVLNLVYEGKFSANSDALSLSLTYQNTVEIDTMSPKSIANRLIQNIVKFGETGTPKQTSLQYNIWKQSIQQREQDEVTFVTIANLAVVAVTLALDLRLNETAGAMKDNLGYHIGTNVEGFKAVPAAKLQQYCPIQADLYTQTYGMTQLLAGLVFFNAIGTIATIIQKAAVAKLRNNVRVSVGLLALELSILAATALLMALLSDTGVDTLVSDVCKPHVEKTAAEWAIVDKMYTLENPLPDQLSFHIVISVIVMQAMTLAIIFMQKTQTFGSLITMLNTMTNELIRFGATFCLIFLAFLMAGRYLGNKIQPDQLQCIKYLIVKEDLPAAFKFSGLPTTEVCNLNMSQQMANLGAQTQQFLTDLAQWKLSYESVYHAMLETTDFWHVVRNFFNAFLGSASFDNSNEYRGENMLPVHMQKLQTYQLFREVATFVFIFKILLLSLLAAMFINRYKVVFENLESIRLFKIIDLKNSALYDKNIGAVTLTFFPVNIIMTPLLIPIATMRSSRLSDFCLKVQYVFMMFLYVVLALLMLFPLTPFIYLKVVVNAMFVAVTNRRAESRLQTCIELLTAILGGPMIVLASLAVDLASLPGALLKDSAAFERKYTMSTDRLNDEQVMTQNRVFDELFGYKFERFRNKKMSLIELMTMHRRIFQITDNMHDLMCRGTKDYRQSLSTVQDYNMTKLLAHKCSIPSLTGMYKEATCEFNVIHAVIRDVEMYNYVDIVLRKHDMGRLKLDLLKKEEVGEDGDEENVVDLAAQQAAQAAQGEAEDDDELKKVDGIKPIGIGPDGLPLKRNPSDVMNNFFIAQAARSFTDIEEQLANVASEDERRRVNRFNQEVENRKQEWQKVILDTFATQGNKYLAVARRDLGLKPGEPIVEEDGEVSGDDSSAPSTKSGAGSAGAEADLTKSKTAKDITDQDKAKKKADAYKKQMTTKHKKGPHDSL